MLGPKQEALGALFYEFSLEEHLPQEHLLRSIDRFVDLALIRHHLAPFCSNTGRPSIDPELLIRVLLVGYCLGIRSERSLCEDVQRRSTADRPSTSQLNPKPFENFKPNRLLGFALQNGRPFFDLP